MLRDKRGMEIQEGDILVFGEAEGPIMSDHVGVRLVEVEKLGEDFVVTRDMDDRVKLIQTSGRAALNCVSVCACYRDIGKDVKPLLEARSYDAEIQAVLSKWF